MVQMGVSNHYGSLFGDGDPFLGNSHNWGAGPELPFPKTETCTEGAVL